MTAGAAENGSASEHFSSQRGWLAVAWQAGDALEFSEQIEQQQDGLEGSLGGKELMETEAIGSQVIFEFSNPVFYVRPAIVFAPDFFPGIAAVGDQDAK